MLTNDDLKRYSVIVENGSGCLFQPMTNEYTYILTAKHIFHDTPNPNLPFETVLKPDGTTFIITQNVFTNGLWSEKVMEFKLENNENYFEHIKADIAILKIHPCLEGFDQIITQHEFEKENDFYLCGFPENNSMNGIGEKFRPHKVESFGASNNYSHQIQLFGGLQQVNIVGMSGCGVLKLNNECISIIGIQSKMAAKELPMGGINFVPINYAKEIISTNADKLEPLLPPYYASFKFLKDDLFKISSGLITQNKVENLTNLLLAKAVEVENSDLTPKYLKDYLEQNLPRISEQEKIELNNKKIWILWFELLTVVNIANENQICEADIPELFKKIRLFYSNTEADYWSKHIHELHTFDYSGLNKKGLVVVASNSPAQDDMHILDLSKIPTNIFDVSKAQEEFDLLKLGQKINEASEFPFKNFNFTNISAFKNGIICKLNTDFENATVKQRITILTELYGRIFTN
jgi:hypothetical protein